MIEPHREEERQVFPPDCFIFEKNLRIVFLFVEKYLSLPSKLKNNKEDDLPEPKYKLC